MSEPKWGSGERSLVSNPAVFNDLLLNWCSTTTSTNMSHQAWAIADLPHRHWKLKYLPDEFRSEDIKDENHPYYSLLQTFDQLRDLQFTTDDIPALACLEPKLQQIGKIIDKLIDLPGPYAKGIFDFTALSAYVHTINDLWSKKNQMYLTPIWRQPWEYRYPYQHYSESLVYDPILLSQLSQISLILDWWLGKPQFDFWIGIIDLNFDTFSTQLEAYVHWYNAVFFPVIKEPPRDNKKTNEKKGSDNEKCEEIRSNKKEESDSESESEEEIDIESIDKECEQDSKGHTNNTNNNTKRIYRLKSDDDSSECDWSSSSDF